MGFPGLKAGGAPKNVFFPKQIIIRSCRGFVLFTDGEKTAFSIKDKEIKC